MKQTKVTLAEGVELWLGDSTKILPQIESVDHVMCDPPYEDHMHVNKAEARGIRTDGYASPKAVRFASITKLRPIITPLMVERCKGWLIAFCTPEGIAPWRDAIEDAGARYKRACFWYKPDAAPQFNGQGPSFAVEAFVTAWCGSGVSRWNGGGRRNLFEHMTKQPDRDGIHETEKPVSLMGEIVTLFSARGSTILDPFMGSGTTGVAAIKNGRKFIGIEKDPEYFEIAKRRLSAALRQPDLFVEIPQMKQASLTGGWPKQKKGVVK